MCDCLFNGKHLARVPGLTYREKREATILLRLSATHWAAIISTHRLFIISKLVLPYAWSSVILVPHELPLWFHKFTGRIIQK